MPIWRGNTYRFTVTSANATVGATYTNNTQTFTVTATITAGTVLFCTGTGAPTASGTLTRTSGTGDATITFSANIAPNVNWGTATNWDTGALPNATSAGTDAIFDSASLDCTVNITTAVCRNLNFTGYTKTITMTNTIIVGSSSPSFGGHSVILSPTMGVAGTGSIQTRANGNLTLTSNGNVWPNAFGIVNQSVNTNPTVTLNDNWTINGTLTIAPSGNILVTFIGAYTITLGSNLTINAFGTSSRIAGTGGSLTTIKMTGTGTYSWPNGTGTGFGLNLTIDAPGQTVTLGTNAGYGGAGVVTGSTFSYVAGTVVCSSTFYLYFTALGTATYTLNLNGSTSPSATTTSTTGVNFNILNFRTSGTSSSQTCTISGNICVVGTLSSNWVAVTRAPFHTSGGTIYVNGDMTHDATMRLASNTVLVLQGTGTWTETTINLANNWGLTWQMQINTTGVRTITGTVGVGVSGSLTYTSGTVVFSPGAIIYANAAQFYGFGSGGIVIPSFKHVTTSATVTSYLYFFDTVQVQILNLECVGTLANYSWNYGGTIGWICDNFSCLLNSSTTNTSIRPYVGLEYTVRTSVSLLAYQPTNNFTFSTPSGISIFTVMPGASQDLYYVNGGGGGGHINSSNGQTVYTRGGTISAATTNWRNWDYPRTRYSTFVS